MMYVPNDSGKLIMNLIPWQHNDAPMPAIIAGILFARGFVQAYFFVDVYSWFCLRPRLVLWVSKCFMLYFMCPCRVLESDCTFFRTLEKYYLANLSLYNSI